MMTDYPSILEELGFSDTICRLADGDIHHSLRHVFVPLHKKHAFPPCFIPLFERAESAPHYYGVVQHWFGERQTVFAECSVENGYCLWEFARSESQFLCQLLKHHIEFKYELGESKSLTNETLEIAKYHQIPDPEHLFALWNEHEDGFFERMSLFSNDPPMGLSWMKDFAYRGDFPHREMNNNPGILSNYCRLELDDETVETWFSDTSNCPPWYFRSDQSAHFEEAFGSGKTKECWLMANSNGWEWSCLRKAVEQLIPIGANSTFEKLMSAWQDNRHESLSSHL